MRRDEGMVNRTVASCPLCGGEFDGDDAYSDHLRDVHDLVDEEGVGGRDGAPDGDTLDEPVDEPLDDPGARVASVAPDDGPPEVALFSAAAAALARPDEPAPEAVAEPPVVPPEPETGARGPDRRPLAILAAVALVLLLVVGVKVLSGGDEPDGGGGGTSVDGDGVAAGGIGPGAGGGEEAAATTTTQPAATTTAVPPSTPPATAPPATTPPATGPPPPPPPPATTAPPVVRATQGAVVSCSRDDGLRTLVYRYVLSGSAADGPREETLVARGRIVVSQVRAPLPGGGSVTVALEPEPVSCS